jgi:hypothetical protein
MIGWYMGLNALVSMMVWMRSPFIGLATTLRRRSECLLFPLAVGDVHAA